MQIKGYEFNNDEELHQLLECDVITYEEYEDIRTKIKANEPIKKQRTNWKQKYEIQCRETKYWWQQYKKLENKILGEKYGRK